MDFRLWINLLDKHGIFYGHHAAKSGAICPALFLHSPDALYHGNAIRFSQHSLSEKAFQLKLGDHIFVFAIAVEAYWLELYGTSGNNYGTYCNLDVLPIFLLSINLKISNVSLYLFYGC